jgi:hypothetical protein
VDLPLCGGSVAATIGESQQGSTITLYTNLKVKLYICIKIGANSADGLYPAVSV